MRNPKPPSTSSNRITTWEGDLPKMIEEIDGPVLMKFLNSQCHPLSESSRYYLPRIALTPHLQSALVMCHRDGSLIRGLPEIQHSLENEQHGLQMGTDLHGSGSPRRVSRILLMTRDGSDRFYHQVKQLFKACSPRLAGLLLDCTSSDLSMALFGKPGDVKSLLASHKNSVHLILNSLLIQARSTR